MSRDRIEKIPTVIKYNWDIVKECTNSDPYKILKFFDNVYVRKAENFIYLNPWAAVIIDKSRKNSHSYIQNIQELKEATKYVTKSELFVYFDLCSLRNYFTFINTKGKLNYLPIWKVANRYNVDELSMNRLLTLSDNNIYLTYEGD